MLLISVENKVIADLEEGFFMWPCTAYQHLTCILYFHVNYVK